MLSVRWLCEGIFGSFRLDCWRYQEWSWILCKSINLTAISSDYYPGANIIVFENLLDFVIGFILTKLFFVIKK